MKKNVFILSFILGISFNVYSGDTTGTKKTDTRVSLIEAKRRVNLGLDKINPKYAISDTMAVYKRFIENCTKMANNIRKVEIKNEFSLYGRSYTIDGLASNLEKRCSNLKSKQNSINASEYVNEIVRYNYLIEKSEVLHDSLAIKVLIPFLAFERPSFNTKGNQTLANNSGGIGNSIYERFYYSTNYPLLFNNSREILYHINRYIAEKQDLEELRKEAYKWWVSQNDTIYSLRMSQRDSIVIALKILLSNKEEKAAIAKDTTLKKYIGNQFYLLALLGDKTAEEDLVLSYKYNIRFEDKRNFLRQMVFVNSPKTINEVVKSFNDDAYDSPQLCSASIRIPIINELSRLYPTEPILRKLTNLELYKDEYIRTLYPFVPIFGPSIEPDWTREYVKSVLSWIKNKFNIVPNGNNKTLRLQKIDGCFM